MQSKIGTVLDFLRKSEHCLRPYLLRVYGSVMEGGAFNRMEEIKRTGVPTDNLNQSERKGTDRSEERERDHAYTGTIINRKQKNAVWNGSYTVEAAVIVSLTIFVLAALMIVTFYVHDRAIFQSIACETATAGSIHANQEERADAVNSAKEQVTASRFLGSQSLSGNVTSGEEEVTASWSALYPVPGFVMRYLAGGTLSIEASWSCKIVDPTDTIRLIRGAGKLITGGDD